MTKEQFVELVGKDRIGFILHMFCDGEEWAIGTSSLKKEPGDALLGTIRAMMCTMNGKGYIDLEDHKKLDNETIEIIGEI